MPFQSLRRWPRRQAALIIHTDGAIRPERGASALAAVFRDEQGRILQWLAQRAGALTCNEAEYAAAIMALRAAQSYHPTSVQLYTDSQVLVTQMKGTAAVRAPALKPLHAQLRLLTAGFESVTFHHIPREQNRLADALANETVEKEELPYGANDRQTPLPVARGARRPGQP